MASRLTDEQRRDRAMLEDELLSAVTGYAEAKGWRYTHTRNSKAGVTQGHVGFPDLVLIRPPRLVFAELKRETAHLSQDQMEWMTALTACMGQAYDVLELVETGHTSFRPLPETYTWRPSDWRNGTIEQVLA